MIAIDASPFILSLGTTVTATILTFFAGILAAWKMLAWRGSVRVWIDGLFTLPLILPPTVVGYFLLLIFGRHSWIGMALEQIGITVIFSWPATVIAAAVVAFPLMYRTTLGAFEQVNPALLDAARTLGAGETRVFLTILLPLARPGLIAGTVLAFARAMGEFGATLMLAGNIPGHTQTMPIAIFSAVEGGKSSEAVLWVVVIVALSLAMIRLLHLPTSQLFSNRLAAAEEQPTPTAQSAQQFHLTPASVEQPALVLSLRKNLPNYQLHIDLKTGQQPVGLLGASGAGKSITLRMIAGVARPDSGSIVLNGRTLYSSERGINLRPAQRRIGVVFQDYALFPHRTVAGNVTYSLFHLPQHEQQARVLELLTALQIAHLANRYPAQISGGERQRVAIARCLAMQPEALLFDEPFAALDPHLRRATEEQMRSTLRDYSGAVLFITHDMEEAFRFCSELVVLDRGQVIASGPRQALFDNPRSRVAAQLTGCKNIAAAEAIDDTHIQVAQWGCTLTKAHTTTTALQAVGYRSHHFRLQQQAEGDNVFPCWLVETSEAPHEMTLYLRLQNAPREGERAHVQADIPKPMWRQLALQPQPWKLQFVPDHLLLLSADDA